MTLSTYPISNGLPAFNLGPSFLEYAIQREMKMSDQFANWRAALSGKKPMIYEDEPWCGYFKMRDRRGVNENLSPIKRPWVTCAIWLTEAGEMKAEFAKQPVDVMRVWPDCTKHPIPYETYKFFHDNERWPEEADAA